MMRIPRRVWLAGLVAVPLATACENLPGTAEQQGAAAGGVGGAAAGAAIAKEEHVLGALLGGALGAGGGYLLGGQVDKLDGEDDVEEARTAVEEARRDPATVADVFDAETADLNNDGFVTMDEVVAMERAGLSDATMIDRLDATGQVFQLSEEQQQELVARGVSPTVVSQMQRLNRDEVEVLGGEPVY